MAATRAHPRSRGENVIGTFVAGFKTGSSTLARGKRQGVWDGIKQIGLIPAHAGKTPCWGNVDTGVEAHPRSRGENIPTAERPRNHVGSSPLTRGKHIPLVELTPDRGLIPAHAGKTNVAGIGVASPGWLIPAHAGKTCGKGLDHFRAWAHPRSRGENLERARLVAWVRGSSPLTRGKPVEAGGGDPGVGLIPAHAGKTFARRIRDERKRAHPRSRGENQQAREARIPSRGSSPLTRGKRNPSSTAADTDGLIPAHAGKTLRRVDRDSRHQAHPRSRGENAGNPMYFLVHNGSSPLTRGKHAARAAGRLVPRLIPAHAGKTSRTGRRRLPSRAHPRSRGENRA